MGCLTEKDLVSNVLSSSFNQIISYSDGLVGSLHPPTHKFITSPNSVSIPSPPFGSTQDLYRRADGFYGHDDPAKWPQPLNHNNVYLAWIPSCPTADHHRYIQDTIIWHELNERDMVYEASTREGVVNARIVAELAAALNRLRERTRAFTAKFPSSSKVKLLSEFSTNVTTSLHRITSTPMKFRDICCGLAEVQRGWLYSAAVLDFVQTYETNAPNVCAEKGRGPCDTNPRLGAFVWNDQDACKLFDAGIPVYYVRGYNTFSTQVVRACTPLVHPQALCLQAASPLYPVILSSSQAGGDAKFAAIRGASIRCFDVTSPFANMHLAGLYTTSYSLGTTSTIHRIISPTESIPSTSTSGVIRRANDRARHHPYVVQGREKQKETSFQSPQSNDDRFRDFPPNVFLPPVVVAWRGANLRINLRDIDIKHSSGRREKLLTLVPDPSLFFGSDDQGKWQRRFQTWSHIRPNWITQCASGASEAVAATTWKTVLTLGQLGPWDWTRKPEKAHQRAHQEATSLVTSTFASVNSSHPAFPVPTVEVSSNEARRLMQELSLVNFRHQLRSLDALADCSAPRPSPTLSAGEHELQLLNHHCRRDELMVEVFGTGAKVGPSLVCHIFAEMWPNRVQSLMAFSKLMETWPGSISKEPLWNRRDDPNLPKLVGPGMEWELILVRHYVQTYYNFFGYPPILPRTL
ncbi:hypothetical protein V5O48_014397 [Marasmius crinis-equi]|uniref:Uncharacterized protein n=1 Tax=Marasmius crinis-equi TaxID=585013 RepID=A0ABR3EXG5_9AGAR